MCITHSVESYQLHQILVIRKQNAIIADEKRFHMIFFDFVTSRDQRDYLYFCLVGKELDAGFVFEMYFCRVVSKNLRSVFFCDAAQHRKIKFRPSPCKNVDIVNLEKMIAIKHIRHIKINSLFLIVMIKKGSVIHLDLFCGGGFHIERTCCETRIELIILVFCDILSSSNFSKSSLRIISEDHKSKNIA